MDMPPTLESLLKRLPPVRQSFVPVNSGSDYKDEDVLSLLLRTTVHPNSERSSFVTLYDQRRQLTPSLPSLSDALDKGWFVEIWGNLWMREGLLEYAEQHRPEWLEDLRLLRRGLSGQRHTVEPADRGSEMAEVENQLKKGRLDRSLFVGNAGWIEAELWARSGGEGLRAWWYRRNLLEPTELASFSHWSPRLASSLREEVLTCAESANLPGWDLWDTHKKPQLKESGFIRSRPSNEIPTNFISKFVLLARSHGDEDQFATSAIATLLRMIMESTQHPYMGLAERHQLWGRVIALAQRHPAAMEAIQWAIHKAPVLLTGLLSHADSAITATYLTATWPASPHPATLDHENDVAAAFKEALRIVAAYASLGAIASQEFAALYIELCDINRKESDRRLHQLDELGKVLASQPSRFQAEVIDRLLREPNDRRDGKSFLALSEALAAVESVVSEPFSDQVTLSYKQALNPGALQHWSAYLRPNAARAVVSVIETGRDGTAYLRHPLNVKTLLDDAKSPAVISHALARSLRSHIRLMSKAIAATAGRATTTMIAALSNGLRAGAMDHTSKGKVAALAPSHESFVFAAPPTSVSADLVAAIRAAERNDQDEVINALAETDEPGVLAAVAKELPRELSEPLIQRISKLQPGEEAAASWTFVEMHANIRALLEADLPEQARKHLEYERHIRSDRKVPGRELERFRLELYLLLKEKRLSEIHNKPLPDDLTPYEFGEASKHSRFYKGLAYLQDRDFDNAILIYSALAEAEPTAAHVINLLAAHHGHLLHESVAAEFTREQAITARKVLNQAQSYLQGTLLSAKHDAAYRGLVANFETALRQPDQALKTLSAISDKHTSPFSASVRVVALKQLGRDGEARGELTTVQRRFGASEVLESLESHLRQDAPLSAPAPVVPEQSAIELVKSALFSLKNQPPRIQATLTHHTFDEMFVHHVREALAGVDSLVPFLKLERNLYDEDDLNALVQQLLIPRLELFGWAVSDQSKGGRTDGPSVGERDLVIKKGATELAVYEAFRFETSKGAGSKAHFRKVFKYSNCKLFFHVTYYKSSQKAKRLKALERMAQKPPRPLALKDFAPLHASGNMPDGFKATYSYETESITVVFLLLDLSQARLRERFSLQ